MGVLDVFKASSIKEENERLTAENAALKKELAEVRSLLREIGGNDTELAKAKTREYQELAQQLKKEMEKKEQQ